MSNFVNSLKHGLAVVVHDAVKVKNAITQSVLPAIQKLEKSESTVEAITALIDPNAVNAERVAYALLGHVGEVLTAANAAADANGTNIALDAALVADIKAVLAPFHAKAQALVAEPAK